MISNDANFLAAKYDVEAHNKAIKPIWGDLILVSKLIHTNGSELLAVAKFLANSVITWHVTAWIRSFAYCY